ncbi:MAG: hypothetical protein K0U78_01985 [Actinomycetia bacterium]|nr:hypothetical protein [Actinomycetes bacterium]
MKLLRLRRLGALLGVIAMLAWPPSATAQPDSSGALLDSPTLSLFDLGSSGTIWFEARRDTTSSTFSFAVPKGLAPVALNATLELPVNVRFVNITATQNGRTISRLELPPVDGAPIVVPLVGLEFYDNWASVTLTVTALPLELYCWDPRDPIRLVNASVTFAGTEIAPTTVAGFLPPALRKLTIGVPPQPSLAESDAAVQLTAAMAARYGWQNTEVGIVPLAEGATTFENPPFPQERQIIVKEGPDKGVSLQPSNGMPALLISGPGDELTNQTRLLADDSLPFALSAKAIAGPPATEPKPASDTTTLELLNQTGLSAESLRPEVEIKLDQSQFAHSLDRIRVHLIGSYTPLADNFSGEVTASVGDDVIDRWPVNVDGTIDRWIDIPDQLVERSTILKVRVHTTGDPGHCNDYLNMTLRIDGSTEIQASPASPPVPPGFRSLPQALMPRIQVGIGSDALSDTVRAAQIIVGLQRNSGVPLMTTVTSLEQAINSRDSAILISADGWTDETFALPFSEQQGQVTIDGLDTTGSPVTLTLDPAIAFGSLQTMFDGQRSILVATSNGAPAQLDELLRWLSAEPGRWSSLEGRAIISVPGSSPITVPDRPTDLPLPPEEPTTGPLGSAWWFAGGVAAVALAGAVLILFKTRKSRTPESEIQTTEDAE